MKNTGETNAGGNAEPVAAPPKRSGGRSARAIRWCREAWWFLGEHRRRLAVLWFVAMLCSTSGLIPAWFLGLVVELVGRHAPPRAIAMHCVVMVGLLLFLHTVRVWAKREASELQACISAAVRERALDQLLSQGIREGRLVGNEVSRLETGLRDFTDLYRIVQNEILFSTVNLLACAALFLSIDRVLFVVMVIYVFSIASIVRYSIPRMGRTQSEVSKAREAFSGLFTNIVGSALSVRAEGAEHLLADRVGASARNVEFHERERARLSAFQWRAFNCVNAVFLGTVLFRLGMGGLRGSIVLSMIVVAFGYLREFIGATMRIFEIAELFVQSVVGFTRMMHLLADQDQIFERTRSVPERWSSLELRHVTHRYPGRSDPALEDVNLVISRGQRVALNGPSGSGKSTCVKILLGLVTPSEGSVLLDGHPIHEYSLESLRREVAIVLQECEILGLTLRENITMLRRVSDAWMNEVIVVCGLDELIARLPDGLGTMVGERGYRLSGGERQRVALARALIRRPSFLVVDEATSMLDAATEERFFFGLRSLLPELTMVLISHHERTHRFVDAVFAMSGGRLAPP